MGAIEIARRLGAITAELALGSVCAGCQSEPGLLCGECRSELHGERVHLRSVGGSGELLVAAAATYEGAVRDVILSHKEHARLGLARALGEALAVAVSALSEALPVDDSGALDGACVLDGPVALVPVPSAAAVVRTRGHDAVQRTARHAAKLLRRGGMPVTVLPALAHSRTVADQSGLRADARHANLAGALRVRSGFSRRIGGAQVVIVDDIVTTGATLREAARALRSAGHVPVGAAVIASA